MQNFMAFTTKFAGRTNVLFTQVGVSQAYSPSPDLKTVPTVTSTIAIWDTGATCSVISKKLATAIGLIPTGKTRITGVNGNSDENTYMVNVYLPNKVCVSHVRIAEVPAISGGADMLIGMDIIGSGDLSVYSENNKTVMSFRFPSVGGRDFVSEAQRLRAEKQIRENLEKGGHRKNINKNEIKKKRKQERQNKKSGRKK